MNEQNIVNNNETEKLKKALTRSYTERFTLLMKLIRIDKMLKSATIIHVKDADK
jgi:hypothetical protein